MINCDARNRLAALIRSYLVEEIKAFAFDDALDEFRESNDGAVRYVAEELWYHYDDCDDHLVVLSKPEWNYFQRLLLLLESNTAVTLNQSWYWTHYQILAFALLICCAVVTLNTGFGYHLLIYFIPFGIGSIAISFKRYSFDGNPILTPFKSFGDLGVVYDKTNFRKDRYPSHLATRRIRSPFMHWYGLVQCYINWSMLAPIPLLFQCFPTRKSDVSIRLA